MATELWLVRHGQAAFGTGDYDRLTDLGRAQARWLGEHLAARDLPFQRIAAGQLRRQRETAEEIAAILGGAAETVPGLEEYDGDGLMASAGHRAHTGDRRAHFRTLRGILLDWAAGATPEGLESWADFHARTEAAVADLARDDGGRVLAVSSGGAIAMILGQTLGLAPDRVIDLNLQARNTGITRLVISRGKRYVNMVNAVPHLERADRAHAETYS